MNPTHPLRSGRLLLVALLALPGVVAQAQETTPPPGATRTPQPGQATSLNKDELSVVQATRTLRPDQRLTSINFPGGPFSKLVASLNKDELSIIQSAGVDPMLPAFSVSEVRIDAVIAALGRLLEPQGYILNPVGPNLAVLTKYERHASPEFASFQLDRKLGTRSAEDVVAAIQQGCEFASEGKPSTLRFKYHPATKLLFVAGTEAEVGIAHRVFGSLPDNPSKEPASPTSPPAKK